MQEATLLEAVVVLAEDVVSKEFDNVKEDDEKEESLNGSKVRKQRLISY